MSDAEVRHYHTGTSSKKTSARALVAIAIILALMTVFSIIAGGVAFGHWWSAKIPAACCTAAKTTYTIIVRETDVSSCPLSEVCSTPGATEIINGTLVLASDGSTVVGYTIGFCITIGEALGYTTTPDIVQECQQEYLFNGEGGITAGKLTAEGSYIIPDDGVTFPLTTWAVTGGTGAYHFPNGGQLTFTHSSEILYNTVTIQEVVVN